MTTQHKILHNVDTTTKTRHQQTLHPIAECCGSDLTPRSKKSSLTDFRLNVFSKWKQDKDASMQGQLLYNTDNSKIINQHQQQIY